MLSWAAAGPAASSSVIASARMASRSVERFAGPAAPVEAVRVPAQVQHPDAVVVRVASRVPRDGDDVARPQRLARDALARELPRAAPFDGPSPQLAVLVRRFDVHERMRVAEQELQELALDLDRAILEIRRRERVMGVSANTRERGKDERGERDSER